MYSTHTIHNTYITHKREVFVMAQINPSVDDKASVDPFYSDANMSRLRAAIQSVETGESTLKEHELIEVDN